MINRLKLIAVFLCAIFVCISLKDGNSISSAVFDLQSPGSQTETKWQEKPAEQVYKNIQVFKGLPASQLLGVMNFMAGSLGVSCNHCHVPNQFSKDDKAAKQTARQHLQMMHAVNDANFGGKTVINCATCHRSETRPASVLTLAQNQSPFADIVLKSSELLPAVDQILEKYLQAIGGAKRIEKLKTLTIRGTRQMRNGADSPSTEQLEIYRKAPNKLLMNFTTPGNNFSQAFSGTTGWRRNNGRVNAVGGADLLGAKRDADFHKKSISEHSMSGWLSSAKKKSASVKPLLLKRHLRKQIPPKRCSASSAKNSTSTRKPGF